jgi:hypothetical protein
LLAPDGDVNAGLVARHMVINPIGMDENASREIVNPR